jgi:hypothetical protein
MLPDKFALGPSGVVDLVVDIGTGYDCEGVERSVATEGEKVQVSPHEARPEIKCLAIMAADVVT